ncbi:MAG: TonB-dependent receptor [Saprospiraceae bacterium]|nr:TonB-dependent receptor [Saprospiraceae bacterium]
MRKMFLFVLALIFGSTMGAQGIVSGTLLDANTAEPLIGANVLIEGTVEGASTDLDGKFQFEASAGTHVLVATYIGYQERRIEGLIVKDGEVTKMDFTLSDDAVQLVEVVVKASVLERTENAVLMLQKKSDKIQDGISSQEMSRMGISSAATAMTKVTGAAVEEGKYINVRGLGDRYSTAQLNGVMLPSTDPYRNSAQLDLIPSNLLENIITAKSFTPDQPGNFTGGNVDIQTKSFPEQFTFSVKTSIAYNTQSSLNDKFLSQQRGSTDWLGYDDGGRALPSFFTEEGVDVYLKQSSVIKGRTNGEYAAKVDEAAKALDNPMTPVTMRSPLNYGLSFSLGDQKRLFGKPLGYMLAANHKRNFTHYNDGVMANWFYSGDPMANDLTNNFTLNDTRSVETPVVGGLAGLAYKLSSNDKISLTGIYNHQTDILSRYQVGSHQDFGILAPELFETRTQQFTERAIRSGNIRGDHHFNFMSLEWVGAYTRSTQDEPDMRIFANEYDPTAPNWAITQAAYDLPGHYFRNLEDNQIEGHIDLTFPIEKGYLRGSKLKFGGAYTGMDRDFSERRYVVSLRTGTYGGQPYKGDADEFFGPGNTGVYKTDDTNGIYYIGNYINDDTRPENSYTGTSQILAAYAMGTLQVLPRLKVIGGLRVETTDLEVVSGNDNLAIGKVDTIDFLPAVSLLFNLNPDMNLRASYSNTLARPNMREMAPFSSFEFIGDAIFLGNPDLQRTRITNLDLRWEWFIGAGELIAASVYYKDFKNPIVRSFTPAANPEFSYRNVDEARVYGIELEARRSLDFISPVLQDFKIGTNLSLIQSVVDIPEIELDVIRAVNPDAEATRPFQGQSPYIVNANLSYTNNDFGWDATLVYNVFGDRLAFVGREGTPDIFEKARHSLDLSVTKRFKNGISVGFTGTNLMDALYRTASKFTNQTATTNEFVYSQYQIGRTLGFSLAYQIP